MTTPAPSKARLLSKVAAASGAASTAEKQRRAAVAERNTAALAAQNAGATYQELGKATGMTKVGVYKMLSKANGGSLRDTPDDADAA